MKVESFPRGYPRLAAFINADLEGRIYRKFGNLRSRLLLYHQDRIAGIEEELNLLDREHESSEPYRLCSRRYDEEDPQISLRQALFARLDVALAEYDALLLRDHQIMSIGEPTVKAQRSYFDYVWNEKPLCKEEYQFIYRQNDFIQLGIQPDTWFGSLLETLSFVTPRWLLNVSQSLTCLYSVLDKPADSHKWFFISKEDQAKSDNPNLQFYSNRRTNKAVKAVVATAMVLLLVLPVVILYLLTTREAAGGVKIGVLVVFVVAFAIAISTLTRATRHEMFAASAA